MLGLVWARPLLDCCRPVASAAAWPALQGPRPLSALQARLLPITPATTCGIQHEQAAASAAYGSASARLEIALVLNNPLPPCWQADQLSALRDIWRSPLVHAKSTSQYPRSLLARAGTGKPRQKAGFDFGTCPTQLRSPWHAANPLNGRPGRAGQCGRPGCACAMTHEMRAQRARPPRSGGSR